MRRALAPAAALALAACDAPQSMLQGGGTAATAIADLWWVMLTGALAVVALVTGLVAYGTWHGRTESGSLRFVYLGGLALPVAALSGLLVYSAGVGRELETATEAAPLRVEVIGHQWWWEVRYPDAGPGAVLANELRVPVGRTVVLELSTADVIHSFWVPALAGKVDMTPGRTARLRLRAESAGTYRGQCAEFCGAQHARMALHVVAESPARFRDWLAGQTRPAAEPEDDLRRAGREAFLAAGCGACHTVRGTDAAGTVGPDLTHVGGRLTIGAGVLPNNIGTIQGWIADSQTIKPGNRMPAFDRLESTELRAIAAWLAGLE